MLNRYETEVMAAVYALCDGTEGCLVSPLDILSILPAKHKYNAEKLEDILYALKCDGYFDIISSERKGEKMYVISLKESGLAYKRNEQQRRRDVIYKIALAMLGAVVTFVFGLILKAIFKT